MLNVFDASVQWRFSWDIVDMLLRSVMKSSPGVLICVMVQPHSNWTLLLWLGLLTLLIGATGLAI
jgi:hypothetical protein